MSTRVPPARLCSNHRAANGMPLITKMIPAFVPLLRKHLLLLLTQHAHASKEWPLDDCMHSAHFAAGGRCGQARPWAHLQEEYCRWGQARPVPEATDLQATLREARQDASVRSGPKLRASRSVPALTRRACSSCLCRRTEFGWRLQVRSASRHADRPINVRMCSPVAGRDDRPRGPAG